MPLCTVSDPRGIDGDGEQFWDTAVRMF